MATVIDELLINLGFDADPTGANRFDASLNNVLGTIGKVGSVMTAVTSVAAGFLGKSIIDTASEFEKFETQLTTIEGSSEKAKRSLDWISEFAEKTPYDIAGVTDAFVKLKSYGLDPANDGLLTSLGNTASAMGKSLDQSIEMMADAVRGESERLKEFGIVGSKNKNEMTYSYTLNGESLTKTVENDAVAIQAALQEIFDEKFAGGMDAMSKTWEGQIAKMGDTWTAFKKRVSERGIFDRLKSSLGDVSSFIEKNRAAVDAFADRIGDGLVTAFDWLEDALWQVWDGALWARDSFNELNNQFGITEKGGAILAGVLALIAANIAGLIATKVITNVISLARGFMLLFSPLALIGAGLLAVFLIIEDIYGFVNGKDSMIGGLIKDYPIINDVIDLIMKIVDAVSAIFTENESALKELFNAIGGLIMAFEPLLDLLISMIPGAFKTFLEVALVAIKIITVAVGVLAKVFTWVVKGITMAWKGLWLTLTYLFDGFFDIITNKISGLMTIIGGLASAVKSIADGEIVEGIKIAASSVWDGGKQALRLHSDEYKENKKAGIDDEPKAVVSTFVKGFVEKESASPARNPTGKSAIDYSQYSVKNNQASSTVTQTINVNSANEAAIIANRTAQGARQQSNGYQ
ncbi:tape measure protein [Psychrobacter sp. AOP7-A1-24]|uniref:tape measure protein n=1 Tax=Psychrobacter sp. AOP7-A1-24 TaxID=3457646 RepID=UPI00402B3197